MIQRQDVPLTSVLTDFRVNLGSAAWVRFFQVDGPCQVKFESLSALAMPVSSPFTVNSCTAPFTTLFISAGATGGILSIVWSSDGEESVDDFLANAAQALLTSQSFLLTESVRTHAIIHPNFTNPQDQLGAGDAGVYAVSAGGLSGQAIETTAFQYYGGLNSSQLATNVANAGGTFTLSAPRLGNTTVLPNTLSTTAPGFTRGANALLQAGYWYFRTDMLNETPVIAVGGHIYSALGIGMGIQEATGANGIGGLRGIGIVWSNGLANNNWHLLACDGTAAPRVDVDTGISAILNHTVVELRYGVLGSTPFVEAIIDGVSRASLTGWGASFAVLTGFAAGTLLPKISAGKLQLGQNGNNIRQHFAGYAGIVQGRLS